jgi:membrane protein DedA with SNARE-associated domain
VQHTLFNAVAAHGSLALFGLLVLGIVGLPVPDETLLIIAGVLIGQSKLGALPTFLAAVLGSSVGITISYGVGRAAGATVLLKYGPKIGVYHEDVDAARAMFHRSGKWGLTFGYFVPGVRHFTALVAGGAELEYSIFAVFAYAGAVLWAATFIGLGYYVGDRWEALAATLEYHGRWLAVVLLALSAGAIVLYRMRHRFRP